MIQFSARVAELLTEQPTERELIPPLILFRTSSEKDQEEGPPRQRRSRRILARGEEAEDRLQLRATRPAQEGVRGQPLPQRGQEEEPGQRAGAERDADQDLVPEQEGQAEEGDGRQGRPGQDARGAGALQPRHRPRRRGRLPRSLDLILLPARIGRPHSSSKNAVIPTWTLTHYYIYYLTAS